jgi:hypothetical protein
MKNRNNSTIYIGASPYFLTHYSYDDQENVISLTDANQKTIHCDLKNAESEKGFKEFHL